MNPTDFPEANFRLLPPPSMPECLPPSCHRYPSKTAVVEVGSSLKQIVEPGGYISRWEPTPEERAAIAAGGPVWVYVVGDGAPPPIAVSGLSPFETAHERAKRTFSAAEWARVFDAYETATGRRAVEDWTAWERWAEANPVAFARGLRQAEADVASGSDHETKLRAVYDSWRAQTSAASEKPATYDLAELCVCGHRRGEHFGTTATIGGGHCGACPCPCPAFLPAAEGPDPFLE